jgi:6-phosphofructokinase 1
MLGTCRYKPFNTEDLVEKLREKGVTQLYIVGGSHSAHRVNEIQKAIKKHKYMISVVGIPSSLDNDVPFFDKSFGFETSTSESVRFITAANVEAEGAELGIGIVRLMGHNCGFFAVEASLASHDVNICVVPEI